MKIVKKIAPKINAYFRNLRFSHYIKLKSPKTKLVDLKLFNKDYLNKDNILTQIMNKYGSDKGSTHHNYTDFYHFLFENLRNKKLNIFEVGLGSIDPNFSFNMTLVQKNSPLCSLRAWKEYFPDSQIFGADIDTSILDNEERIKTFFVDQTNPETIKSLFKNMGVDEFDIILEDGLHEYNANICFFENSIKYLGSNGIYIIEDVYYKDKKKFIKYFKNTDYNYAIVDIFHKKNIANNCVIIVRKNNV